MNRIDPTLAAAMLLLAVGGGLRAEPALRVTPASIVDDLRLEGRVELPEGTHTLREPLVLTQLAGATLSGTDGLPFGEGRGDGWTRFARTSRLRFVGLPPDQPAIVIRSATHLRFEGVTFIRDTPGTIVEVSSPLGLPAGECVFRDCSFIAPRSVEGVIGVAFGRSRQGVRSDLSHFEGCTFYDLDRGLWVRNDQSVGHLLTRCQFNDCRVGIELDAGGDTTLVGGASYRTPTLIAVNRGGRNVASLTAVGFRLDGAGQPRRRQVLCDATNATGKVSFAAIGCTVSFSPEGATTPLVLPPVNASARKDFEFSRVGGAAMGRVWLGRPAADE